MHHQLLLNVLFASQTILGCMATRSSSENSQVDRFKYDPSSGQCINDQGETAYNKADLAILFHKDGDQDIGGFPHPLYAAKNAECVDFSDVDFNQHLGTRFPRLMNWNLRGANLNKARLFFAMLLEADLAGARFDQLAFGYTEIKGTIDQYTQIPQGCTTEEEKVSCRR